MCIFLFAKNFFVTLRGIMLGGIYYHQLDKEKYKQQQRIK